VEHKFFLEVEAEYGAKAILLFGLSDRHIAQFGRAEFCGKIDVLVELDFV
jgi:hypothetical protein